MNQEQAHDFGAYIRHTREAHQLSIRGLATQAGIDDRCLAHIEHGDIHAPRPDTLRGLATALDVSLADLFVLAGYTIPQDLPCIETYLRAKYSGLSDADIIAVSRQVEKLVGLPQLAVHQRSQV